VPGQARPFAGPRPDRVAIAGFEPFERLGPEAIQLVADPEQADTALRELLACPQLGFDTESRPTFAVGELSTGPHVVQFATLERAWVFQLRLPGCQEAVARLLAARNVAKIGFGLEGDRSQILRRFGVEPQALVDLNSIFRRLGCSDSVGARGAVALVFRRRLPKPKKLTTSNWSQPTLSPAQLVYAANDAYAAIRVWQALAAPGGVSGPAPGNP
jgi:ribonuclease D